LSRCVAICPVGFVEQDILEHIAKSIERRCGLRTRISQEIKPPRYAYNEKRGQYNSKVVLKYLLQCHPFDAFRVVGVTCADLYVPILKYVFGLAQMHGRCSIISTLRLYPQFYGQPQNRDVFCNRLEKTALHELGHCVGLTHCRDCRCVMYSSSRIEDTDFKRPDFCPTCYELFCWYLEADDS